MFWGSTMQNAHSQGEWDFASGWSGQCAGVRGWGGEADLGPLYPSPFFSSCFRFGDELWILVVLVYSLPVVLNSYSCIRYLYDFWSCTRHIICPGDKFLCTSLQFFDWSLESWGFISSVNTTAKSSPIEQYVFTDIILFAKIYFTHLLHDSEHLSLVW